MFKHWLKIGAYLSVGLLISCASASPVVDFFRALNVDNADAVSALLQQGFDPNTADDRGELPLYLAAREGSGKVLATLLADPRTQVDARNAKGETALMMAALRGRVDWLHALVARGAVPTAPAGAGRAWTALHYAVSADVEFAAAQWLLARGASINARSPNGSTPLMMAARYGQDAVARQLVAQGADVGLANDLGMKASDFARSAGRESLADWLQTAAR